MRIVLTGGSGQLGRALTTELAPIGQVICTDRATVDLARPDTIKANVSRLRPNLIINAAAFTDVERAESEESLATTINGTSVGELAITALELDVPLVHYSTDYVFDGTKPSPYVEEDLPAPLSAYGRSKLEGEKRIRQSGCSHLIVRTSWVYAPAGRNFLTTMLRLAAEREELRVVDDQWGAPTFAGSIAKATAEILQMSHSDAGARRHLCNGEILHVVNEGVTNWFGFASEIFERIEIPQRRCAPRLVPIKSSDFPTAVRRPANSRLSTDKVRTVWGLVLPHWRDALADCVNQLR